MTAPSVIQSHLSEADAQSLKARLYRGLEALRLSLSEHQCDQLLAYAALFHKWNKAYNLSAVRDLPSIVDRHLIDSLAIVCQLPSEQQALRVLDVGTGGGLPGIPLAIVFPEWALTLLDSNGKKTRFLFQVATQLQLGNVTVEHCRVEGYAASQLFDAIVSRAFASLEDMYQGCKELLAANGHLWAMKGLYPTDELAAVDGQLQLEACHRLQVPGSDGERHLLILSPRRFEQQTS